MVSPHWSSREKGEKRRRVRRGGIRGRAGGDEGRQKNDGGHEKEMRRKEKEERRGGKMRCHEGLSEMSQTQFCKHHTNTNTNTIKAASNVHLQNTSAEHKRHLSNYLQTKALKYILKG